MRRSHDEKLSTKLKRSSIFFFKGVGAGLCIAFIISIGQVQAVSMVNPAYTAPFVQSV